MRVLVSLAAGEALYPHPQWKAVQQMWELMYPLSGLSAELSALMELLRNSLPEFSQLLLSFRPVALSGRSLGDALCGADRTPEQLQRLWSRYRQVPDRWHTLPPTLAFAAISQARSEGRLSPEGESRLISRLLIEWAVKSALASGARRIPSKVGPFPYISPNLSPVRTNGRALVAR
jgi:hypothetical protein